MVSVNHLKHVLNTLFLKFVFLTMYMLACYNSDQECIWSPA